MIERYIQLDTDVKKQLFAAFSVLLLIVVGMLLSWIVGKLEKKFSARPLPQIDPTVNRFISRSVKILMWILVLIQCFKILGLDTTSIVTVVAASGAAIALALQASLSNLASGIMMVFTKPFKKGDYISVSGMEGSVDNIDLFTTTVITADNRVIEIPNSTITGSSIINTSAMATRRIEVRIGVSYTCDLDKARRAVLELAEDSGLFLESPASVCNVSEYAEYAVKLVFWGWVEKAKYGEALNYMNNELKKTLDKAGIPVSCPRIEIHSN